MWRPRGEGKWRITTIHKILENEAYTGTLVWGNNAKDGAQPVRVENAFPAIVTAQELQRVKRLLKSRSPKTVHPRRASSPYLLSGLAKCALCGKTLTAAEAKSGKYTYYVCQSILKTGSGACAARGSMPSHLKRPSSSTFARTFSRKAMFAAWFGSSTRRWTAWRMSSAQWLESIEVELEDVKRRLGRVWHALETTDLDTADAAERIKELRDRKEKLEQATEEAHAVLSQRRELLDRADTIAAFAADMSEFLRTSELTETRSFIRSFVKEIQIRPGKASIVYTIPMPKDSPVGTTDTAELALNGPVMNTIRVSGAEGSRTPDLFNAIEALSQLSYSPTCRPIAARATRLGPPRHAIGQWPKLFLADSGRL